MKICLIFVLAFAAVCAKATLRDHGWRADPSAALAADLASAICSSAMD
jgi:hypothetical protein